jgi:putative Mn2+ efflux pump MntP
MSTMPSPPPLAKGAALQRPKWTEAFRTGPLCGVIEALTPRVGWLLGSVAAKHVTAWDPSGATWDGSRPE